MKRRAGAMNPFRYGALAIDEAFTDRDAELRELASDMRNGQDVVVFAPRRYGKSSLVWNVAQDLRAQGVLIAHVDLMTTPTKERLAEKLAKTVHEDLATRLFRARDRALALFRGLRITPHVTIDPTDGSVSFSFEAGHQREDVDATLERLLELPGELGAGRRRQVAVVFDEFQEVVEIDRALPQLMRAVFQTQPKVAHVYLGSKRHMMERIFNDENEPFWRSAKRIELGLIEPQAFAAYIENRFAETGKGVAPGIVEGVLAITGGHPYATQELCYFVWEECPARGTARARHLEAARRRVLQAEHAHFSLVWENASRDQRLLLQALAREPGRPFTAAYRSKYSLPPATNMQKAVNALRQRELVARDAGRLWRIVEPFLAEWVVENEL